MKHLDIVLDVNGDNLQLQFHPDSLVMMVSDLKQEGLSDEEIAVEIENLRASILEDYKQKLEDGTLDENDFEDAIKEFVMLQIASRGIDLCSLENLDIKTERKLQKTLFNCISPKQSLFKSPINLGNSPPFGGVAKPGWLGLGKENKLFVDHQKSEKNDVHFRPKTGLCPNFN